MEINFKLLTSAQSHFQSAENILRTLDLLAKKLTESLAPGTLPIYFEKKNIALAIANISPNLLKIDSFGNFSQLRMSITSGKKGKELEYAGFANTLASFKTKEKTFKTSSSRGVYSFSFRNSKLFQSRDITPALINDHTTIKRYVESTILAVKFLNHSSFIQSSFIPNQTIELSFKKINTRKVVGEKSRKCSFWDPTDSKKSTLCS